MADLAARKVIPMKSHFDTGVTRKRGSIAGKRFFETVELSFAELLFRLFAMFQRCRAMVRDRDNKTRSRVGICC